MEKIYPLLKKMRISRPKTDLFFQNLGHADFEKTDPFSLKFRTMMRTTPKQWEWRDRAPTQEVRVEYTNMLVSAKPGEPNANPYRPKAKLT